MHRTGVAGPADTAPAPALSDLRRLRALAESGLTASPDEDMQYIADRVRAALDVPVALVSLVEADRQVFPGMVGLPEPWVTSRSTPLSHSFCRHVVVTEQPLVIDDARLDPLVRDSPAVPDLGVVAYAGMPLTDADGRVLGSLCAIDRVPRAWTDAELDILRDLARACSTQLRLRLAVHLAGREARRRDELDGLLRTALQDSQLLLAASQALTSQLDTDHKLAALAASAVPALADICAVYLLDPPAPAGRAPHQPLRTVRIEQPRAPHPEGARPLARERIVWPGPDPLTDVVTSAHTVVVSYDPDDPPPWSRTVGLAQVISRVRLHASAMTPVVLDDRVHAVIAFGAGPGRPAYDGRDRALLTLIAAQAGVAVRQGSRYEHVRDTALTLQRALLTAPPAVPGLQVGVRYRPALATDEVGGDWYDVLPLPGGDTAVVVGDVAGHNIEAAATMGQLRSMLRGFAHHDDGPPHRSLAALDRVVHDLRLTRLTTGVYARLTVRPGPAGVAVQWSNAGHPPPIVVHPGRSSTILHSPHDAALGVNHLRPRTSADAVLPPGSTLLLFTDGLFERRRHDLDDSLAALAARAGELAGRPLDELCDALVDGAPHEDDLALVALRGA